jgi:hypothetical protein
VSVRQTEHEPDSSGCGGVWRKFAYGSLSSTTLGIAYHRRRVALKG